MEKKLISSDFDFTLFFRDDEKRTTENFMAIKRWRENGNLFAITTSRNFASLRRQISDEIKAVDYLILDGGSGIFKPNGELVYEITFKTQFLERLLEYTRSLSEEPKITYFNNVAEDFSFEPLERLTKIRLWFREPENAKRALFEVPKLGVKAFSFGVKNTGSKKSVLDEYTTIVEVIPEDSGKNVATAALARELGISREAVITVGDGENDVEMIRDFDGFTLTGSPASKIIPEAKQVDSVALLVEMLNNSPFA